MLSTLRCRLPRNQKMTSCFRTRNCSISAYATYYYSLTLKNMRLSFWLSDELMRDLPDVAFGVPKVSRSQPPRLVYWGLGKLDSLRPERLVSYVNVIQTRA